MTAEITQVYIFQIMPDAFIRVQIRGVTGQALQVEPFFPPVAQKVLNGLSLMGRQTIPNDQQLTDDMSQQVLQKPDNLGAAEGLVLGHCVKLAFWGDSTNDRQVLPKRILQYRGLTSGSP